MTLLQRSFLVLLLICLGCSAQSTAPDTAKAIERQVRSYYKLPPGVQVTIGPIHPSEFNNYDAVKLTFTKGTRKDEYDFLLSKDNKTLVKMTEGEWADLRRELEERIEAQLIEGLNSPSEEITPEWWDRFRAELPARLHHAVHQHHSGRARGDGLYCWRHHRQGTLQ